MLLLGAKQNKGYPIQKRREKEITMRNFITLADVREKIEELKKLDEEGRKRYGRRLPKTPKGKEDYLRLGNYTIWNDESYEDSWMITILDHNDNEIFEFNDKGRWSESEYNEAGLEVSWINSKGESRKYIYDDKGNEVVIYEDGVVTWKTYDENNNHITTNDSEGYWAKKTYDSHNRELTHDDSYGGWSRAEYDENGWMIKYEDEEYWEESKYDAEGNRIWSKSDYKNR